jgi:hypothetical protein
MSMKAEFPMLFLVSVLWRNLDEGINFHKKGCKDFFFLYNYNNVATDKMSFILPTL